MASPADEALPALPPIKTSPLAPSSPSPSPPSASGSPSSSPAPAQEERARAGAEEPEPETEKEPSTPTSEESRLRQPAVCPPAPRKPPAPRLPAAKRKSPLLFADVPRDLSAVFRSLPPKKRIRAW